MIKKIDMSLTSYFTKCRNLWQKCFPKNGILKQKDFSNRGKVIWLTGLSGAGKSTIAIELLEYFKNKNIPVHHLDGDSIRTLFPATGFSEQERNDHIKRVGYLAHVLEQNGITVICSFISPFSSSREFVRSICKNFVEVYVSTPLSVCENRDVKGLYAKARKNEISNFTGIDSPYEPPTNPEVVIDTSLVSVDQAVKRVLEVSSHSK